MIVACGAEGRIARKYAGWVEESRRRGLKISPLTGAQYAPLFFSIYATMALCFWFGFKLYLKGHIDSVGTIVIVLTSVMMIAFSIGQTAAPIVAASKAAGAAADFFAVSKYLLLCKLCSEITRNGLLIDGCHLLLLSPLFSLHHQAYAN